ncbi:MAG: helix-turn-helix domain-containing protein [Sneathiellales bacterium]|nr:helix-turn-helix domain-containing protein [Sneathiellales bacterium]
MRRTLLGLSQTELGQKLGLTFQQIQKYEQGLNRIGSSRLYELSKILKISIAYFFEDLEEIDSLNGEALGSIDLKQDPAARRETLELVRSFARIDDKDVRQSILTLIHNLNDSEQEN